MVESANEMQFLNLPSNIGHMCSLPEKDDTVSSNRFASYYLPIKQLFKGFIPLDSVRLQGGICLQWAANRRR